MDNKLIEDTKKMLMLRFPRFGAEIAGANIKYNRNLKYHTAATDGKNIYVDPDYLASLSDDDKVFLIAHEIMHIKFEHMYRLADKNGINRDPELWNIATDAIIDANLERDGLKIKDGYVNMPEAINYTSEEFYEILKQRKEQKEKEKNQSAENGENDGSPAIMRNASNSSDQSQHQDDHTMWQEAFEDFLKNNNNNQQDKSSNKTDKQDEKAEFEENREERKERAMAKFMKLTHDFNSNMQLGDRNSHGGDGEYGEYNIDWKKLLRREIEKNESVWSQRRSVAENNYAYRLSEYTRPEESETEIILDSSGSISRELLRDFLHEVKKIIKGSKIKVGVFSDAFYGWKEIKSEADIDALKIPGGGLTNFDSASRAFSKNKNVNKICFTDGEDYGDAGITQKRSDIIWLSFRNKDFKPDNGRVIFVEESKIKHHNSQSHER